MQNINNPAKTTVQIITSDPHRTTREERNQKSQFQQQSPNNASKIEASNFTCSITGMEFVFVKGGTYIMGDGSSAAPRHEVTVSDFHIGKFQVTQAEWQKIMGTSPSEFEGERNPVENVSWNDCKEFIKKLNQQGN